MQTAKTNIEIVHYAWKYDTSGQEHKIVLTSVKDIRPFCLTEGVGIMNLLHCVWSSYRPKLAWWPKTKCNDDCCCSNFKSLTEQRLYRWTSIWRIFWPHMQKRSRPFNSLYKFSRVKKMPKTMVDHFIAANVDIRKRNLCFFPIYLGPAINNWTVCSKTAHIGCCVTFLSHHNFFDAYFVATNWAISGLV